MVEIAVILVMRRIGVRREAQAISLRQRQEIREEVFANRT
jgi:hypothetical protein